MDMTILFLVSLCTAICVIYTRGNLSYILWALLLVAIIMVFRYHASDVLSLSF